MHLNMIKKLFIRMSTTQIVSAMTTTLCVLIDALVVGRLLGVGAMSAYGIANPVIIIVTAFGTMMTCGVQVLLGKRMGSGDMDGANRCYTTSVVMSLLLAALTCLMVFALGRPLCELLGAGTPGPDNPVFDDTLVYLRGYLIGAPFFFLAQIMSAYLQALGKRRLVLLSVAAMTVTDVVLDLMAVYVFHNGMFGIGLASALSHFASFAVGFGFFLTKKCPFRLRRKGFLPADALEIIKAGSPALLNQVFFTLRVFFFNRILLELGGTDAVAAFALFNSIANLLFSIGVGAGSVTLLLASVFYSDEDRSSIEALTETMVRYTLVLIVSATLLIEIFAPQIIRMFLSDDPAMLSMAVPGLRIFSLSMIVSVINNVYKNYFQGIRHRFLTNLIAFLQGLGLMVPVAWLFSRNLGLTGFWVGTVVAQLLTRALIAFLIWRKYGEISFSGAACSYLDPGFGTDPENLTEASITDLEGAVGASERMIAFCREKGMTQRTSMMIGLCVEEIAVNVIEHGFTKDRLRHNMDVRLILEPEKCLIRFRDNCAGFDPTTYLDMHRSDDPAAHIGLRTVMGIVSEANYINALGLNNLTLMILRDA